MHGKQDWCQADIAEAFQWHGIFDKQEMDISHRLTFEDKKTILATIREHGRGALVNVTKGGIVFYDRDAGTVCGPDREFLEAAFLQGVSPDTASLMSYVGPSKIVLFHSKSHLDQKGLVVVDSYSPFKDRALFQKPLRDEVINGYRFSATMQRRNSLHGMRPGITSCVIKPAATYAEAAARFHSPAASAGA